MGTEMRHGGTGLWAGILGLIALGAAASIALAQTTGGGTLPDQRVQCSPRPAPGLPHTPGTGIMDMGRVAEALEASAPSLTVEAVKQTAHAVPTVSFVVRAPVGVPKSEWLMGFFEAVVFPERTDGRSIDPRTLVRGRVLPPTPTEDRTSVIAEFPGLDVGWLPSRWRVAIMLCVDPGADPRGLIANGRALREIVILPLYVSSLRLSAAAGLGAFAALYLLLAFTARHTHERQIAVARDQALRDGRPPPKPWGYALRPTVICQDSFGFASLARFQVLLFTLVLVGVYAYVMSRTGELANMSPTVLTLLGITLTGSTLARVTEGSSLDTANRLWLLGTGIIDPSPRLPRWQDLLAADGEIDVTRVQALAFSLFAAVALILNGTGDLANFTIPDELNYLIGLSQAVYVAGKALPRDSAKRLNEEIRAARDAETAALLQPGDAAAVRGFETARNAIGSALFDVFGERFRDRQLRSMQPGDRMVPPVIAV